MSWIGYLVATIFALVGTVCTVIVAVGLPGTWIMLGLALVIEWADRFYLEIGHRQTFGWWLLLICIGLAIFGEILEFLAGAIGAKRAGSSRRGTIGALIGGLLGAIAGLWIPMPLIGSLIGSFIGTFIGAMLGEISQMEATASKRDSLRPAWGATVGRILGTVAKLPIAFAVWLALSIAAFWP